MSEDYYKKPALSYAEQLVLLKQRGLQIDNESKALHLLENISYYRLSGYWYPMLTFPKSNHLFKKGSTFENAFKLYCFDSELRKLILSELEKIEIAVRAKMIYILWHKHGPFWFTKKQLFKDGNNQEKLINILKGESERSDEEFIRSFKKKYADPLPPACMILEISSFGNLSNIYKNLRPGQDRRAIANYFGLDDSTFSSWLHSFTYVRNLCAHHSRFWNKRLGISPQIPISPNNIFLKQNSYRDAMTNRLNNNTAYFLLSMLIYLLNVVNPKHSFKSRFRNLLHKYPIVDIKAMGFLDSLKNEPLWR